MPDYLFWMAEIVIGAILALIGWVFKMVFSAIAKNEKQTGEVEKSLANHKLHAAETFATKVDVDRGFDRVMDKLESMDDKSDETMRSLHSKIDKKADKSELEYFQKR